MRIILFTILIFAIAGCETVKYPLHDVLKSEFRQISEQYHDFVKYTSNNGDTDTLVLSKEDFLKLSEEFMKEFPDVSKMEGTPITQDHKYQGKRKFINYNLDAAKKENAEVSIMFSVNSKDEDKLWMVSYTHSSDEDRPNPILRLHLDVFSKSFTLSRRRAEYYKVEWK